MRPRTDDEILGDLKDWPVRNIYVERGVKLIEQLRQRVQELEKQKNELWESFNLPRNEDILATEKLTAERDELLKAMALAMPVMDAHAGDTRKALFYEAIASVKEK